VHKDHEDAVAEEKVEDVDTKENDNTENATVTEGEQTE
jgi:hypothetical protein